MFDKSRGGDLITYRDGGIKSPHFAPAEFSPQKEVALSSLWALKMFLFFCFSFPTPPLALLPGLLKCLYGWLTSISKMITAIDCSVTAVGSLNLQIYS